MKIAQIAPPWLSIPPKNYGGTENVVHSLVEEQVTQGHQVTLYAPGDAHTSAQLISFFPTSLIDAGVPWHAHLKAYYHLQKAVDAVKKSAFDILHIHLSSSSDLYLFPLLAGLETPHVMTLHSCFPFDRVPDGWTGDADALYMEWAPSIPVVAISEHARAEVVYPLCFVGVVHHGVPMEQFRPTGKRRCGCFVWLGRLVPEKGAHLAIQAARAAGVPLVLAGTVDHHIPEAVHYFQDLVKPYIDQKQVRYIGPVTMQEKIDLLSRARGLLNPIQWAEPFGMVIIEAMALGCPVISFAQGAAPELIVHGRTGFLVQDIDAMVSCMAHIDEIDRAVTRQHVEEHFSARVMAEKYMRIYQKIIDASKVASKPAASRIKIRVELIKPASLRTETMLSARIARLVAQKATASPAGRQSEAQKQRAP